MGVSQKILVKSAESSGSTFLANLMPALILDHNFLQQDYSKKKNSKIRISEKLKYLPSFQIEMTN